MGSDHQTKVCCLRHCLSEMSFGLEPLACRSLACSQGLTRPVLPASLQPGGDLREKEHEDKEQDKETSSGGCY